MPISSIFDSQPSQSNVIEGKSVSISVDSSQSINSDEIDQRESLFKFDRIKIRLDRLISKFTNNICSELDNNIKTRFIDISVAQKRQDGTLLKDETMIPVRIIDSNIRREQPSYIAFLKQSRRLAIFKCITNCNYNTEKLEDDFTQGMTYSGWDVPHFKVLDGSQTHGWDSVEVVFDNTKPFNVGIEHIGTDKLIFPLDSIDIQTCEIICRVSSISIWQLHELIKKFGFSSDQVKKVADKIPEYEKDVNVIIYKLFFKYQDVVYVAWFNQKCDDWLKAPTQLYLGRQQLVPNPAYIPPMPISMEQTSQQSFIPEMVPQEPQMIWQDISETRYPIFILPYAESLQEEITKHCGRVFLDKHKQEAMTANISSFLNGCQRASFLFTSVDGIPNMSAEKIESIKFEHGKTVPVACKQFKLDYPEPVMLKLAEYLETFNSQEVGNVNFAVNNRQDTRKTAREVSAASEEASLLRSVQVSLYSTFIREIYSFVWLIVQSQGSQGKITILLDYSTGQNDMEALSYEYDIRAAGDTDLVKRQELLGLYMTYWPVVQNTPIALPFLAKMLKLAFAEDGVKYADMLMQNDPRIIIQGLLDSLKSTLDPNLVNSLDPKAQDQLATLIAMAEQYLSASTAQGQQSGSQQPQQSQDNNPSRSEAGESLPA